MKPAAKQSVALPSGTGVVRLPRYRDGWLADPLLIDATGAQIPPMSFSIQNDCVTYRWWVQGVQLALRTNGYRVQQRHEHKPLCATTDGVNPHSEITVAPFKRTSRPPVWSQARDSVGAAIVRTGELHRELLERIAPADRV